MIKHLEKKSVLLIAPEFYGYHNEIINLIRKTASEVVFFSEIAQSVSYRISKKVYKAYAEKKEAEHLDNILAVTKERHFDVVLVIRGGVLTPDFMLSLRENLKSSFFCMYQWDSYAQNDYRNIVSHFDFTSTFDINDAKELGLTYVPLFFTDEYQKIKVATNEKNIDMVFFGAYHSDRLKIVKFFSEFCSKNNLKFKSHLFLKKIPLLFRLMKREIKLSDLPFIKTYPVTSKEISQSYAEAYSVLDVELAIQSGLSMRTFEVLGSGLKLITTNSNVLDADFYNEEQICVIDRKNLKADIDFFNSVSNVVNMESYHIQNWLKKVLNE